MMLRLSALFLGLLGLVGLYFHSTLPVTGHIRPGFFVFYTNLSNLLVLVYELAGPTLTKIALTAAGEIRPEGRTSARVENKPEEVAQKVVFCRNVTQSLTNPVIFCILSLSALAQFSYCVSGC